MFSSTGLNKLLFSDLVEKSLLHFQKILFKFSQKKKNRLSFKAIMNILLNRAEKNIAFILG
jgi:hypothetical protein